MHTYPENLMRQAWAVKKFEFWRSCLSGTLSWYSQVLSYFILLKFSCVLLATWNPRNWHKWRFCYCHIRSKIQLSRFNRFSVLSLILLSITMWSIKTWIFHILTLFKFQMLLGAPEENVFKCSLNGKANVFLRISLFNLHASVVH